jgi:DNA-binding LytR/AlgR family response regulator
VNSQVVDSVTVIRRRDSSSPPDGRAILRLVSRAASFFVDPLPVRALAPMVAALTLTLAGYCLLHGVVLRADLQPSVSLGWGLANALPWWLAWEGCKHVQGSALPPWSRGAWLTALLVIALVVNVAACYGVSIAAYPERSPSLAQVVYQRAPIAVLMALGAWLLLARQLGLRRLTGFATPAAQATIPAEREPMPGEIDRSGDERDAERAATPSRLVSPRSPLPGEALHAAERHLLRLPTRDGTESVPVAEIEYVKAAGNYVELFALGRSWLLRTTLTRLATELEACGFSRVHRSILVNRRHVSVWDREQRRLRLTSGVELPLGRSPGVSNP